MDHGSASHSEPELSTSPGAKVRLSASSMKYLLSDEHRVAVVRLAKAATLLAFDFDGTLSPIIPSPHAAGLPARTAELLRQVCVRFPTALLTGRALADIRPRLAGVHFDYVVGNHGIEPSPEAERCRDFTRDVLPWLERSLAGQAGIELENKHYSLSIHYRHAPDHARAREAIYAAIQNLPEEPRTIGGKCVVSLTAKGAPDKGTALTRIAQEAKVEHVLYVGDDDTDEDVFRSAVPGLLGVRVGYSPDSAAPYFLREQEEINDLLALLIEVRGAQELHCEPA